MDFAKEFMTKIDGKVSEEDMRIILQELEVFQTDYDISRKETGIVPYTEELPECYKAYMVSKKIEGLSKETLKTYSIYLVDFLREVRKPIDEITSNDIRLYIYNYQKSHNVVNRTMDGKRIVINTFFEWLKDEGYVPANPCKKIHPIKFEVKPREPLSGVEMELVREACITVRDKAIIETFYSTGCRVSELSNLNKDDIDFDNGEVHLFGKGAKHRTSYINAKMEVHLKKYLNSRLDDNPALFVGEKKPHGRLKKTAIEKVVRDIGVRSGIGRRVFPHLIRHTTATDALNRGMTLPDLQELYGHCKPETTRIYAKTCNENVKYSHSKYIV